MKESLLGFFKSIISITLLYTGFVHLYCYILSIFHGNPVTILCVHRVIDSTKGNKSCNELYLQMGEVEAADFERKLHYLTNHYNVISLNEYLDASAQGKKLPRNSVVLTFDDGYLEHFTVVYPLLKRFNIPAIFYVATSFLSPLCKKWDDEIVLLIAHMKKSVLVLDGISAEKKVLNTDTIGDKARAASYLRKSLKYMPPDERAQIMKRLGNACMGDADRKEPDIKSQLLTWEHVKTMASDPLVTIGSHTCSHPILADITEEGIQDELSRSKDEIEKRTGIPVRLFCYPFGKRADFDERTKAILKGTGFRAACSFCYGRNDAGTDIFELKRIPFLAEPLPVFKLRMTGIFDFISIRRDRINRRLTRISHKLS